MSIVKRPDRQWRARYRGPDRIERSKHFRRKVDAEQWLAAQSVTKQRGEWVDPARSTVLFSDWAEQWLSGQQHVKPSTRARYAGLLGKHVVSAFGAMKLSEIGHGDVQDGTQSFPRRAWPLPLSAKLTEWRI